MNQFLPQTRRDTLYTWSRYDYDDKDFASTMTTHVGLYFEPRLPNSHRHKLLYVIIKNVQGERYFSASELFNADDTPTLEDRRLLDTVARTLCQWHNEQMKMRWGARWLLLTQSDCKQVADDYYDNYLRIKDDIPSNLCLTVELMKHSDDVQTCVELMNAYAGADQVSAETIAALVYRHMKANQLILDNLVPEVRQELTNIIQRRIANDDHWCDWMDMDF